MKEKENKPGQRQLTIGLAKNWLTKRSINFCFAIVLLQSARHYKFGSSNNNEFLIINLAAVRDGPWNTATSPGPDVMIK